jgi:hypothetical protein
MVSDFVLFVAAAGAILERVDGCGRFAADAVRLEPGGEVAEDGKRGPLEAAAGVCPGVWKNVPGRCLGGVNG